MKTIITIVCCLAMQITFAQGSAKGASDKQAQLGAKYTTSKPKVNAEYRKGRGGQAANPTTNTKAVSQTPAQPTTKTSTSTTTTTNTSPSKAATNNTLKVVK